MRYSSAGVTEASPLAFSGLDSTPIRPRSRSRWVAPRRDSFWRISAISDTDGDANNGSDADKDEEEASKERADGGRTSVKRSFLAKCLSPLIGYATDFELVQFVYDLNLWATLESPVQSQNQFPRLSTRSQNVTVRELDLVLESDCRRDTNRNSNYNFNLSASNLSYGRFRELMATQESDG